MLLLVNMETYLYISLTIFYYVVFFSLIVRKNMECGVEEILVERSSLPRRTFIEMTEISNE